MRDVLHDVGICVVNYGSHELLERNLIPLDEAVRMTVVVDNFSTVDERRAIEALARTRGWSLLALDSNVGFGAGMNAAVATAIDAGCERVLLLNPDVTLDDAAIEHLVTSARSWPRTLVTPRLAHPDGSTWFDGGHLDLRRGLPLPRAVASAEDLDRWLTGACLLVERSLWEELGGFDPRFFLYWEDVELSHRCLQLGGALRVMGDVTATHDVGGTQRGTGKSPMYCRQMCANRLRFASLHLAPHQRLRWVWYAPRYAVQVLTLHGRRDALHHPRRAAAAVRGTAVGVALVLRSIVAARRVRTGTAVS